MLDYPLVILLTIYLAVQSLSQRVAFGALHALDPRDPFGLELRWTILIDEMEETQGADIFEGGAFLIDAVIHAHIVLQLPRERLKRLPIHPQREQVH